MSKEQTFIEYLRDISANSSPLDFYLIYDNLDRFLMGAVITLEITFLSLLIGGMLAIPLAIARAYKTPWLNGPIWCFTYFFRGTPLLVQTYLFYFGLGQFEAVRNSMLWDPILSSAWWCVMIAFVLNTTAYTTEFLCGVIQATSKGEIEASKACGMSPWLRMYRIVLPSAFRRALPAYSNEVIFTLHGSVIASTVTLQDLLGVGRWLNGRYYLAYEGFITAMMFYMCIVLVITLLFRKAEKRWLAHMRSRELEVRPQLEAA
ncbi:ABC transporter permease [Neptunomonas sp.]|uniref:ABC transporter permease n=1 Tax=Neptunomonas sp. TaxID=1971898 RepID=UPI0035640D2A